MAAGQAQPAAKKKVLFILGATATGKSRLSIDMATRFPAEVINSDKIQIYKGLDVITNKLTHHDMRGVPHHLLSVISNPNADYTKTDFCLLALHAIQSIHSSNRLPIIVGGSNSHIEALVDHNPYIDFKQEYDSCFVWIDADEPILFSRVSARVDEMVDSGLLSELCDLDFSSIDCDKGIYRSIGVPELRSYFLAEKSDLAEDESRLQELLRRGIDSMKKNTCDLAAKQAVRIKKFAAAPGRDVVRIDASRVFDSASAEEAERIWEESVRRKGEAIVEIFLKD
uniref:Uncharacterized protein n=1 Tax=Kalanchoe fedtschenkoi TaxID=63787 RepID=A0A7N0T3M6_KALFE